ncbi:MAG: diguanylate cyclase [Chitinispirillales bacterium]|jgi:diguanylate cyclase (GGDEF)-like protein|nr:diguanylate cyclase [Chitinispirillales bacterium]
MKHLLAALALISLSIILLVGLSSSAPLFEFEKIKKYQDIPGVLPQEINAIENLKKSGRKFIYAAMPSVEAFESADGSFDGFTPLLCKLLTGLFGIEFEVHLREWDEIMGHEDENGNHIKGALELREIDFTGELTPTNERVEKGFIMSEPIAERLLRIFTDAESVIKTEKDLNGLTLGFLEETTTEDDIRRAYPKLTFKSVNTISNYKSAADMINLGSKRGGIDAFVDEATADPVFDEYPHVRSKLFFTLVNSPVSMTSLNQDLEPVISVFNKYLAAGGARKLYELYKKGEFRYNKNKLYNSFEAHEKDYLNNASTILVAFETDNYPTDFYNKKENSFQGIAIDVLTEISKLTGLKFKPVKSQSGKWSETLEMFKAGEIQMIGHLIKTEDEKEPFLFSGAPYASCNYAILSRADFPEVTSYQIAHMPVGIMESSGKIDAYKRFFNSSNLVTFPFQFDCMDALESRKIDLVMGSEYTLLAQTNYREKTGLRVNFKLAETLDSYFGFDKDEVVLQGIINKAQSFVNTSAIESVWTGKSFDYSKKYAEQRALIMTVFLSVILAILAVTVFLFLKTLRMGEKLKNAANNDALTDICNRRHFIELCLTHIERSMRTESESFVIIFDLDHFKQVNDTHGHLAGDKVLKETTQRVKNAIRPYDVFGRYGGEEFIILMPDIDKENVLAAVERIRKEICRSPVKFEETQIQVSASFGIALVTPKIKDINTATGNADKALYRAKKEGRNRAVFYEEEKETANTPRGVINACLITDYNTKKIVNTPT